MTTFKINDSAEVRCSSSKTRNGFCHRARLFVNGRETVTKIASYLNRTWESYTYETVLRGLLEKSQYVPKDQIEPLLKQWGKDPELNGMGALKTIANIAAIGEIFADAQKDKNDWKKRMLKAGLGEGMIMPDDWDTLSEDEKEKRLNKAIDMLGK